MSSTERSSSRSLVYIQEIFRSGWSTWFAVIVPVQNVSGLNQGSQDQDPPGLRCRRMHRTALRMRSSVRT